MKWLPVLVLLAFVPGVLGAIDGPVRDVTIHQFQDVTFIAADFFSDCETGDVDLALAGTMFEFIEWRSTDSQAVETGGDGRLTSGCGTMRKPLDVLPGADHVVVRFEANREIVAAEAANSGSPLIQDLVVREASLREVQSRAVFEPTAGEAKEFERFEFTFVGDVGDRIHIDWVFADANLDIQAPISNPASGQAFGATVQAVSVESIREAAPSQVATSSKDIRDGTRFTTQHLVKVQAPDFERWPSALRVRVAPGLDLARVIGPDGQDLGTPVTFEGGVLGLDHQDVVVEFQPEFSQAVVPAALVGAHGAGEYVFVFEADRGIEVSPALLPFSIILLLTPLPFAALAWFESRAFRREAFGGYARSARNLQWAIGLVLAYYGAVVASAAAGGRLDLMAIRPVPLEGILLYLQLVVAGVAFTVLWLVARELYLLVKPRPLDNSL